MNISNGYYNKRGTLFIAAKNNRVIANMLEAYDPFEPHEPHEPYEPYHSDKYARSWEP